MTDLWVVVQLFWVYKIITISILIKPLLKFGEAAHLVFIFFGITEDIVGQSLTSKFRVMLIRSAVHNTRQIKLAKEF